jgi:hypothetical protein
VVVLSGTRDEKVEGPSRSTNAGPFAPPIVRLDLGAVLAAEHHHGSAAVLLNAELTSPRRCRPELKVPDLVRIIEGSAHLAQVTEIRQR